MPYYFGEGDRGWDELVQDDEAGEYRPPKVCHFRYLAPPDVGGAREPVRFSDQPPPPLSDAAPARRSLLDRLLRRGPPLPAWERSMQHMERMARRQGNDAQAQSYAAMRERRRQAAEEQERRGQQLLALCVAALREIGARRAYCRYDGGNDEGFAWLDHVELRSGERLAPDEAARRLAATRLTERLAEVQLWHLRDGEAGANTLRDVLHSSLATDWAAKLLGEGYGTGPFYLYGAFTADLDSCIVVDDRNADPVVENIEIER
jgi:hypothetical protein